jgi:ElaB/YqjD/DUF883 family membrane-anchored ribosome-binding protein
MEATMDKSISNGIDAMKNESGVIGAKVSAVMSDASAGVKQARREIAAGAKQIESLYSNSMHGLENTVKRSPIRSIAVASGLGLALGFLAKAAFRSSRTR